MMERTPFSGWYVFFACFTAMFFVLGGAQTFAVFIPAIMEDTGFSLSSVAMMSTIATVASFTGNLLFPRMFKIVGAKWLLVVCSLISGLYYVGVSYSTNLTGMYLSMVFGGVAAGLGTVAPVSVIVSNWFIEKRATCMSIAIAGSMFGCAALMLVSGLLIEAFEWRMAYRVLGIAVGAVSALVSLFFIVESPALKGQLPYGAGSAEQSTKAAVPTSGVTPARARASASFWLLLLGVLLIGCSTNVENFLPAFWKSKGMTVGEASTLMSVYAAIAGACAIFLGRVTDKMGGKAYICLTTATFAVGTLGVLFVGAGALPLLLITIVIFATGAKKTSNLTSPLVVNEIFGRLHYGALIGYFTGVLQLGIALSNPIIGELHRFSGGYSLPFITMAIMNAVALILILLAMRMAPKHDANPAVS